MLLQYAIKDRVSCCGIFVGQDVKVLSSERAAYGNTYPHTREFSSVPCEFNLPSFVELGLMCLA